MKLHLAIIAAALAACAPITPHDERGPDQRHYTRAGDVVADRVFNRGDNCGPDCFEALARSGCDYDCRKKAHVAGVAE